MRRTPAVLLDDDGDEGLRGTRDEMSYPDWRQRLARAERELAEGDFTTLDTSRRRRPASRKTRTTARAS